MSIFEALLQHDHVPNFYRVENTRSAPKLEDVAAETRRVMKESGTLEQLKPGQSVCIAAGSREIANIALIVRTVCEVVREHGAEPFIIPAMGSHAIKMIGSSALISTVMYPPVLRISCMASSPLMYLDLLV